MNIMSPPQKVKVLIVFFVYEMMDKNHTSSDS